MGLIFTIKTIHVTPKNWQKKLEQIKYDVKPPVFSHISEKKKWERGEEREEKGREIHLMQSRPD